MRTGIMESYNSHAALHVPQDATQLSAGWQTCARRRRPRHQEAVTPDLDVELAQDAQGSSCAMASMPDVNQLLCGWLAALRAEESCQVFDTDRAPRLQGAF